MPTREPFEIAAFERCIVFETPAGLPRAARSMHAGAGAYQYAMSASGLAAADSNSTSIQIDLAHPASHARFLDVGPHLLTHPLAARNSPQNYHLRGLVRSLQDNIRQGEQPQKERLFERVVTHPVQLQLI